MNCHYLSQFTLATACRPTSLLRSGFKAYRVSYLSTSTKTTWLKPDISGSRNKFPMKLKGTDHIFWESPILHVLPGRLDIARAHESLTKALEYYPHAAGRLRRNGDEWSITSHEVDGGIPITFEEDDVKFDQYEMHEQPPPSLIDSISTDLQGPAKPEWDEPLVKVKLTSNRTSGETYIGISFNHILGDADFNYKFLSTWSRYYQGLDPIHGPPTFEPYRSPPPDEDPNSQGSKDFVSQYAPHLLPENIYPVPVWGGMFFQTLTTTDRVDLMFTKHQLQQLKVIASAPSATGETVEKLSWQDALSAYVVTALNQSLPSPIQKISNIFSYRQVQKPENLGKDDWTPPGKNAVGNPIFRASTPKFSAHQVQSIGSIARSIRKSIASGRDYEFVKKFVSVSNPIWDNMTKAQQQHVFWEGEGAMGVNSVAKLRWNKLDFGIGSDRVRTPRFGSFAGYIRFFAPPPVRLADGKGWEANEDGAWMVLRVPKDIKDKFLATVCSEMNSPVFPQNILRKEKALLATKET